MVWVSYREYDGMMVFDDRMGLTATVSTFFDERKSVGAQVHETCI